MRVSIRASLNDLDADLGSMGPSLLNGGLLFQGSIWRPAVGAAIDWDRFHYEFAAQLARALGVGAVPTPWPDLNEDEVSALVEQYSGPEWNEFR